MLNSKYELTANMNWCNMFILNVKPHVSSQWRHNKHDGVSNHQPHDCLFNRLFRCRSEKTSKLRVTGLCAGNSPVTGEFLAQRTSNAESFSIWWRHHVYNWHYVVVAQILENNPTHRKLHYHLNWVTISAGFSRGMIIAIINSNRYHPRIQLFWNR